jgi:hypothetical protein
MAVWKSGYDAWRMMTEAQTVIAFRMMGLAGFWTLGEGETTRMITEKQRAFAHSAAAWTNAAMRGHPPERIFAAAIQPLGRATSGNVRRLSRAYSRQQR